MLQNIETKEEKTLEIKQNRAEEYFKEIYRLFYDYTKYSTTIRVTAKTIKSKAWYNLSVMGAWRRLKNIEKYTGYILLIRGKDGGAYLTKKGLERIKELQQERGR